MKCSCCQCEIVELPHYRVTRNAEEWTLCGRRCMVALFGPEVTKAIAIRQWIPTAAEDSINAS